LKNRIIVIPNGIDILKYDEIKNSVKNENSPVDGQYILTVARFYPRKNIPFLIKVFKKVTLKYPMIKLVLAGDGFEFDLCRKLVQKLGLNDRVVFTGFIDDRKLIIRYYRHCHIFCHPSHQETFGNVVLEAMAAEKPIIGIKKCAVPELITHEKTGLLAEPHNEMSLEKAFLRILEDEPLGKTLAHNARQEVETKFTTELMCKKYTKVIGSLRGI